MILGHDHPAGDTVDQLRAELKATVPNRTAIETHVHHLRSLPEITALVANWFDDPATQRFLANLSATGL
jgi:hypothetical protein